MNSRRAKIIRKIVQNTIDSGAIPPEDAQQFYKFVKKQWKENKWKTGQNWLEERLEQD